MNDTPRIPGGFKPTRRYGPKGDVPANGPRRSWWRDLLSRPPGPPEVTGDTSPAPMRQSPPTPAPDMRAAAPAPTSRQTPPRPLRRDMPAPILHSAEPAMPPPEPRSDHPAPWDRRQEASAEPALTFPNWLDGPEPGEVVLFRDAPRPAIDPSGPNRLAEASPIFGRAVIALAIGAVFILGGGAILVLLAFAALFPWLFLKPLDYYEARNRRILVTDRRVAVLDLAYRQVVTQYRLTPDTPITRDGDAVLIGPNPPRHHPILDLKFYALPGRLIERLEQKWGTAKPTDAPPEARDGLRLASLAHPETMYDLIRSVAQAAGDDRPRPDAGTTTGGDAS